MDKYKITDHLSNLFNVWNSLNKNHEYYEIVGKEVDETIDLLIKILKEKKSND